VYTVLMLNILPLPANHFPNSRNEKLYPSTSTGRTT
jgi:hypothetical protein